MSQLSAGQAAAVDRVASWLAAAPQVRYCSDGECLGLSGGEEAPHTHGSAQDHPVLSIGGLAGRGKTHLVGALAELLGKRVSYGTPTNKSAAVLRGKLPEKEQSRCSTYHSLLYRPVSWVECLGSHEAATELECRCGLGWEHDDCSCARFRCSSHPSGGCKVEEHLTFEKRAFAGGYRDLVVVDEASMVTQEQVDSIRSFGLPVLLVGDHGQLPPVKGQLSPWMAAPSIELQENFRQSEESGIVGAAMTARQCGFAPLGKHGLGTLVARGADRPELYDALLPHRLPPGPEAAIITWTNKGRADINRRVHLAVAAASGAWSGQGEAPPLVKGERLVSLGAFHSEVVKPQDGGGWKAAGYQSRLFNGQVGTVLDVLRVTSKHADVVIQLEDPSRPLAGASELVKVIRRIDLAQLGSDRQLRPDERSRGAAALDYAYCLTAHKSQGSEFSSVAVVGQGPSGPDRARWLYTAMTRAKKKLLVII